MNTLQTVSSACALIISSVLIWAGIAKFQNRVTTANSFRALGLPKPTQAAVAVPAIEMLTGALAVWQPRIAGVLAAFLFVCFTLFLVAKLRAGAPVSCGCFGSADPAPVSWVTICRNVALIVATIATVAATRPVSRLSVGELVAVGSIAAGLMLISALIISLLSMKATIGVVFSQSPPRTS
jgi:Methylamine utilisation protein MauE